MAGPESREAVGRRRRRAISALVVGVVGSLLAAGCVTADRSVTTVRTVTTAGSTPTTGSGLTWRNCEGGFECATLEVPIDHARPGSPRIGIGVVRQPARDPGRRIGSLFMNPGGPGGSAINFVLGAAEQLDDEVQDRFDLVGFDPRGVGRSEALDCAGEREMYLADPTIEDAEDRRELLETSRAFVADCDRKYGDLLPHLGTDAVARDMDLLRIALGEDQISYLGLSYGTSIGQAYFDRFPQRVRAMVLDGVVDLTKSGIEAARAQALGFEDAMEAFAADCRADSTCPLTADPIAAVERVLADAERVAPSVSEGTGPAGPGLVTLALVEAMYAPSLWPALADAVASALDGDSSGLARLSEAYLDTASFEIYFAVSCLDTRWPPVEDLLAAAKDVARVAPHFGEALVTDYVRCSLWPTPAQPLRPATADGAAPILVVSTTNDPATPYAAGVALAESLDGAVLLTKVGDGHTATLDQDPCIDRAVVAYLLEVKTPLAGTRC